MRIAAVLVLAVFLARGTWLQLAAAAAFLAGYAAVWRLEVSACGRALWRLRFLCLAVPATHFLAHGPAGFYAALRDLAGLVLMVLAVALLLSPRSGPLLSGLAWWLRPLDRFGLPGGRCALRVGLTLQWVPWAQAALADCTGRPARGLVCLARILSEAAAPPPVPTALPERLGAPGPPPWQWCEPLLLAAGLWLVGTLPGPWWTGP